MQLTPSKYFTTSGKASSKVSDLNAFDVALINAGISEQNLVAVSSVLPVGIVRIEKEDAQMDMGAVTHCVLSQMRGIEGEIISAGIAYALRTDGVGGYVAEGHLHGSKADLDRELRKKMKEMARIRNVELEDVTVVTEELKVPKNEYGCCIASVVFTEYR